MREEKNIFTIILIALLTLSAYIVADTVDAVIGKSLDAAPMVTDPVKRDRAAIEPRKELSHYNSILERGLFGDGKKPSSVTGALSQPSSVYRLIGTVEGDLFAGAVLQDDSGEQSFYRIRAKLPDGSRIVKVLRDTITVKKPDDTTYEIEIADDTEIVEVSKPKQRGRRNRRNTSAGHVKRMGKDKWMVDQRAIESGTENLNQLLTQARALPYIQDGKTAGFRLSEIVPGSIFQKIGLQNGDVIQRVNENELDDPGKFFQVYQSLKDEKSITIDVLRGGQPQTFNYEIR